MKILDKIKNSNIDSIAELIVYPFYTHDSEQMFKVWKYRRFDNEDKNFSCWTKNEAIEKAKEYLTSEMEN